MKTEELLKRVDHLIQGGAEEVDKLCSKGLTDLITELRACYVERDNRCRELRRTKNKLQEKAEEAERLNTLIENALNIGDMAWWEMELPSGRVRFNENKVKMLGRDPEDFHHYGDFMELVHPDDYEKAMNAVREHIEGKRELYQCEYRIRAADDEYLWFHDLGRITDRREGKLVLQGIVRNITKQKKLEKTLQESEERAAALLRAIPDLMFRTDRDGVYLDYKAALEDLVSEESADRIGKRRRDVLPPEAAEKIDWYTRETLDTGQMQQFEYRLKIPGKGWRVAEARMVPSGENEVISIVRDVTEQKEQQRALKESEKRYRMIAENTGDVICLLSKDFRPVYISPSSEAVFGYSEDDFAEKDLLFMVHPEDKPFLLAEIENGLVESGRKEWRASFRIKKKSGELCWVEAVANWIMDESGALKNILTVHRDITAQKNLEFQLQFLMRELNHRVKNNLYLVSSLIRLKNESLGDKVDLSDLSNQVFAIQEAHRLLQESENLTTVSLRRYVESLLSATLPQWHGRPVGIEKNIEDLEIPSRTATSIGIIISELSINAMKHGFGEAERPRIKVSIEKTADDEELMLIFSNSGRPFPKELDIENTPSLGFRLINASVQQLKGSLELERAPEPVFTIRFPVQGEVN